MPCMTEVLDIVSRSNDANIRLESDCSYFEATLCLGKNYTCFIYDSLRDFNVTLVICFASHLNE